MGHLIGKDLFRKLGRKIDGMEMRAPWNDQLHALLKELYCEEEADVVVKMPYVLSSLAEIEKISGYEKTTLRRILDGLTAKGLVIDVWIDNDYYYLPAPMMVGIFEFTMMRLGPNATPKQWARLFHEYLDEDDSFRAANFGHNEQISIMRALPHEEAIQTSEYFEVLDYEKVSALIAEANRFSIGLCSCRHEKLHIGEKSCEVPLETCY